MSYRLSVLKLFLSVVCVVDAVYFIDVLQPTKWDHWISWRVVNIFLSELIHFMSFEVAHAFGNLNIFVIDSSTIRFHVINCSFSHDRRIELFFSRCQRTWIPSWDGGYSLVVRTDVGIYLIIVLWLFYLLLVLWIRCLVYRLDGFVASVEMLSAWEFSDVAWHLLVLFDLTLLESWRFSYYWAVCKLLDERWLEVWIDDELIFNASALFDVSSSALFAVFAVLTSSTFFAVW